MIDVVIFKRRSRAEYEPFLKFSFSLLIICLTDFLPDRHQTRRHRLVGSYPPSRRGKIVIFSTLARSASSKAQGEDNHGDKSLYRHVFQICLALAVDAGTKTAELTAVAKIMVISPLSRINRRATSHRNAHAYLETSSRKSTNLPHPKFSSAPRHFPFCLIKTRPLFYFIIQYAVLI